MSMSPTSQLRLGSCHPLLQRVITGVAQTEPVLVIEGHRGQAAQDKAFREKKSKLKWPNGKHNKNPSHAVDIAPLPLDWNDKRRFELLAKKVLDYADSVGVVLRWGGDWDRDGNRKNNKFDDLVHFELVTEDVA